MKAVEIENALWREIFKNQEKYPLVLQFFSPTPFLDFFATADFGSEKPRKMPYEEWQAYQAFQALAKMAENLSTPALRRKLELDFQPAICLYFGQKHSVDVGNFTIYQTPLYNIMASCFHVLGKPNPAIVLPKFEKILGKIGEFVGFNKIKGFRYSDAIQKEC